MRYRGRRGGTIVLLSGKPPGNKIDQERRTLTFRVKVDAREHVIDDTYGVVCAEGVRAVGPPVVTRVILGGERIYLPLVYKRFDG